MFDLTTVLSQNKDCPVREVDEGVVILGPSGDMAHSLEGLGAFIWSELDGSQDLGAVLAVILEEYDIDEDTARTDLLEFADQLAEAGLVIERASG